jgi:hypothetical protein
MISLIVYLIHAGLFIYKKIFNFKSFVFVRDVLYPGGNQHSLDTMCGRPYDQCTKESLMKYLGVDNPSVPFPIYIDFSNDTSEQYQYYNQTTYLCSEPIISRYENKTACGCLVGQSLYYERRK